MTTCLALMLRTQSRTELLDRGTGSESDLLCAFSFALYVLLFVFGLSLCVAYNTVIPALSDVQCVCVYICVRILHGSQARSATIIISNIR